MLVVNDLDLLWEFTVRVWKFLAVFGTVILLAVTAGDLAGVTPR
jgi:hypothetical protein